MKQVWLLFFALSLAACKNDQAPGNTPTETPTPTSTSTPTPTPSPEPVTQEETRDQAVIAQDDHSKATITGSNVTMRKEASVQSEKIGSFTANEKVEVLESKNVNNDKEAILTKAVTLQGGGGEITLTKGKAVIIEEYQSERNYYAVSYEDPKKGKLTADIPADAIETISYSTWYRVKKANGEIGWVLGKFLKN